LAAGIEAAGHPYRTRAIILRVPRQEGHQIVVEDTRSGRALRVSSPREWWERLHGPEIRRLAKRVRWVGGERAPARRDLVAEYQRLAGLLGLEPAEIHRGSELGRAVEELLRAAAVPLANMPGAPSGPARGPMRDPPERRPRPGGMRASGAPAAPAEGDRRGNRM